MTPLYTFHLSFYNSSIWILWSVPSYQALKLTSLMNVIFISSILWFLTWYQELVQIHTMIPQMTTLMKITMTTFQNEIVKIQNHMFLKEKSTRTTIILFPVISHTRSSLHYMKFSHPRRATIIAARNCNCSKNRVWIWSHGWRMCYGFRKFWELINTSSFGCC
jgi:hypothetical protein